MRDISEGAMKMGVVIANTGTPDDPSPEAVRRYLKQFLSNGRIVPMNRLAWSVILNAFILPRRSVRSARKYERIWSGEFAFIRDHRTLAGKLGRLLSSAGRDVPVEYAMSFGSPSVEHALRALMAAGCDKVAVLPLYPQNAFSQASIVADEVAALAPTLGWEGRARVLGGYSDEPTYLDAVADSVRAAGFDPSCDRLLMSFHSIPLRDVRNGDTYAETSARTAEQVAQRLGAGPDAWHIGYQSRFDRSRAWVGPSCGSVLEQLARQDFPGTLFVVCPNFAVDCLETYHDILVEMRADWATLRRAAGFGDGAGFAYVPCLGATDRHAQLLRTVLESQGALS